MVLGMTAPVPHVEVIQRQLQAEAEDGRIVAVMYCPARQYVYVASRADLDGSTRLVMLCKRGMARRTQENADMVAWVLGHGERPEHDRAVSLALGDPLPRGRWVYSAPGEDSTTEDVRRQVHIGVREFATVTRVHRDGDWITVWVLYDGEDDERGLRAKETEYGLSMMVKKLVAAFSQHHSKRLASTLPA